AWTWGRQAGPRKDDKHALRMWSADKPGKPALWPLAEPCRGASFSPDGKVLAVVEGMKMLSLWDASGAKLRWRLHGLRNQGGPPPFSADGKVLAVCCGVGTVQIWDAVAGRRLATSPAPSGALVESVAFLPGGKALAAGRRGRVPHLWEVPS